MSAISELAQTFERNAKQQASDTRKAVESALQQHERDLIEVLRSSEQNLAAAIHARDKSLRAALTTTETRTKALIRSGWKWLLGSILVIGLPLAGALWWSSQTLAKNYALIEQQRVTMDRAQALGIQFSEDPSGQYIILPQGVKPLTGWTMDSGQRQVIKLEK